MANTAGSGSDGLFVGQALAQAEDLITITINYRLGPLGFLTQTKAGAGGMHGLADMVVALQWVQENAAAFGGDPGSVMVFGESAGGCATCTLSVSPAASGLMRTAIVQSGPCLGPWEPAPIKLGLALRDALFAAHGVASMAGLGAVAPEKLVWPLPTGGFFLDDGLIMPQQPKLYLEQGKLNVDSIIFGSNSFDGTSALLPLYPKPNASQAALDVAVAAYFGVEKAAAILRQYSLSRFQGSAAASFNEADSDHCTWRVCACLLYLPILSVQP